MSLTNADMSDREVLLAIVSIGGRGTSSEIANAIGKSADEVSSRLSWMKRSSYGLVQATPTRWRNGTRHVWELTEFGQLVLDGRLRQDVARAVHVTGPGGLVLLMRELGRRYASTSSEEATVQRRQWQHGLAQRRRP